MNTRAPIIKAVANAVAVCALLPATLMPESTLANVLRYVAIAYITFNLLLEALRGYRRRRPHWTAQSWHRYLATCAIPVGAFAVVACLLIALELQLVGEPASAIRALFAVITAAFLVVGAIGLVVVIRFLNQGEPSGPFIGPRGLFDASNRPGQ
jgi:hypothetical protein